MVLQRRVWCRRAAAGRERALETQGTGQEEDGAGARDGFRWTRHLDGRSIRRAVRRRRQETNPERRMRRGGASEPRRLRGASLDATAARRGGDAVVLVPAPVRSAARGAELPQGSR